MCARNAQSGGVPGRSTRALEGTLLAWGSLSILERIAALFLLVIGLIGVSAELYNAKIPGELIFKLGGSLAFLGALLNPQSFSRPNSFRTTCVSMPKPCYSLYVGGCLWSLMGGMWWYASTVNR